MITENDQSKTAKQYRPIIIAYRNGSPVRLSDVAEVEDSFLNVYNAGSFNANPVCWYSFFVSPAPISLTL